VEKVAPSERFRRELDEVLAGVGEEHDPVEVVGWLGARLILQHALEDEVTEFLGRSRYERAEETVRHRNGYELRTVKTTSGSMDLERPRVRDASKLGFQAGFSARVWPGLLWPCFRPGAGGRREFSRFSDRRGHRRRRRPACCRGALRALGFCWARVEDESKSRRQGLVVCRVTCPLRAFVMRAPVSRSRPTSSACPPASR
jgi:Transposase, Mutator family